MMIALTIASFILFALTALEEIAQAIATEASPDANIIMGMNFDETMHDDIKVVLFATKK